MLVFRYKTQLKVLLISLFLTMGQLTMGHPVHVSVCNIEIENNKMTLSLKLFKDDFQLAIEHNFAKFILLENADKEQEKKMIEDYVKNMFFIVVNKKDTLKLNYKNSELNDEAIWLNYESEVPDFKKLYINNSIFLDIYLDQTNLVIINYNGKQNGYRFNYKNNAQQIDLK